MGMPEKKISSSLKNRIVEAEDQIYQDQTNLKTNWNDQTLLESIQSAGFKIEKQLKTEFKNETLMAANRINTWFSMENNEKDSYADYLKRELTLEEIENMKTLLSKELAGRVVQWKTTWLFVKAIAM